MCYIAIESRSVRLKLDMENIELNKIVLKSSLFDYRDNRFTGDPILLKDPADNMEDIIFHIPSAKRKEKLKQLFDV
ncbi:hypothetical protein ATZ36_00740 [Candidatus Endomicrobiellum trichonymphae]|uniref:Uncharacterized protein n=1 Tax=Endomicrobium trichonymphae TaxID=1408204 RepID=A0A1E5IJ66_ENDTX|nr:hypothetical protein ATZ36_00740 [Candidatus Endomicrobium trichonymphae]